MNIEKIKNTIVFGDCIQILKQLPNDCIDLTVTSPPYDNLRDYKGYDFKFENIAKQLYRITKNGGVVVWVVGDATINGDESGTSFYQALSFKEQGFRLHDTMIYEKNSSAFPARRDGNRYTQIFQYMFVFSKGKPKTVNLICDKPNKYAGLTSWGDRTYYKKNGEQVIANIKPIPDYSARNNIWKFSTGVDNNKGKHPAIFPQKLAQSHILSWCNQGDLVLDPMCGSGTTCKMAKVNNRDFIGIDISEQYCNIARERLNGVKNK